MLTVKRLAALGLALALLAGCTCAGCGEAFRWSAALPATLDYASIRALAVRACRNGACVEGNFRELDARQPSPGTRVFVGLSDPAAPDRTTAAWVELEREPTGSFRVSISWSPHRPADGDRYLVEVTDPSGAVVAGLAEETVGYTVYRANGPLDPTECRTVVVERSMIDAGR